MLSTALQACGLGRPAGVLVGGGEVVAGGQGVGVGLTQNLLTVGQGPLEQRDGLGQPAGGPVGGGQVVAGGQGVGVGPTQNLFLGVPYSDQSILSTKYEGGQVHSPNTTVSKGLGFAMKKFGKEQTTHLMTVGDKVYPTKIEVNEAKDTIVLGIVACDTCNKTDPPTYMKANVVFQFPKGSLLSANAGSVEDVIGQLLSISSDDSQQGGDQGAQQQQGGDQGGQPAADQAPAAQPAADQQPPAEPASIDKGMTPDQVEAALGKPDKKVNLGPKMIYYYKDMKVIFINGKVSDVQ
jgi:hypothetical protein